LERSSDHDSPCLALCHFDRREKSWGCEKSLGHLPGFAGDGCIPTEQTAAALGNSAAEATLKDYYRTAVDFRDDFATI